MAESVYKVIELVGTSSESWEKAAAAAVSEASKTLRDLRVAEISTLDVAIENGKMLPCQGQAILQVRRWQLERRNVNFHKSAGLSMSLASLMLCSLDSAMFRAALSRSMSMRST